MKDETDITDSGVRYFPVNISCGNCPNNSSSNEETETKLFDLKRKSARLTSRMKGGSRSPYKALDLKKKTKPKPPVITSAKITNQKISMEPKSEPSPKPAVELIKEEDEPFEPGEFYHCGICDRTFSEHGALLHNRLMPTHGKLSVKNDLDVQVPLKPTILPVNVTSTFGLFKSSLPIEGLQHFLPPLDSTKRYKCLKCKHSTTSSDDFWSHLKNCITDEHDLVTQQCCFCQHTLQSTNSLLRHIKRVHCVRRCLSCYSLVSQVAAQSHSLKHRRNGNSCTVCSYSSNLPSNLGKHFSSQHFESTQILDKSAIADAAGNYHCIFCDQFTPGLMTMLKRHYMDAHSSKSDQKVLTNCGTTPLSLPKRSPLQPRRKYSCSICGRFYTDRDILDRHVASHKRSANINGPSATKKEAQVCSKPESRSPCPKRLRCDKTIKREGGSSCGIKVHTPVDVKENTRKAPLAKEKTRLTSDNKKPRQKQFHSNFCCTICYYQTENPASFSSHIYRMHNNKMNTGEFQEMNAIAWRSIKERKSQNYINDS